MVKKMSPKLEGGPTVLCLGEVLIDFIANTPGSLQTVASFLKCPGGAPANVAVGLTRLGISCGLISKVGADPFGDFLIKCLKENDVDTDGVTRTNQAPTALAFVALSDTKEPDFFFYRNPCADLLLREDELPENWFQHAQFLHVGSVSLTQDPSRRATITAVKLAKQNGMNVSFDPNIRLDLWAKGLPECRRIIRQLLSHTDVFLPSQEELSILMDTTDLEKAVSQVLKLGPQFVCVKQGLNGALLVYKEADGVIKKIQRPAYKVDIVDTTGAGDGFNAGFIAGLVQKKKLSEALEFANAVAALVITQKGAMTALPTLEQLTQFLEHNQ